MSKRPSDDEMTEQTNAKRVCDETKTLRARYAAFEKSLREYRTEKKLDAIVARMVDELKAVGGSDIKWFELRHCSSRQERALHFSYEEERLEMWEMSGTEGFRGVKSWNLQSMLKNATVPMTDIESSVRMWILESECRENLDSIRECE